MAKLFENIHKIFFLDIETAGISESMEGLTDRQRQNWERKSNRFVKLHEYPLSEEELSLMYEEKAAIFAEFARIICISTGYIRPLEDGAELRIKSFRQDDEAELLNQFANTLNEFFYDQYNHFICGHNIREFDIPFICRRLIINDIRLPNLLNIAGRRPWQVTHLIDTLDLWKFGDFKHFTSLELLCSTLDIDTPKDNMSGDQVHRFYWEGRLDEIVNYCEKDVAATVRVFQKLKGLPLVKSEDIKIK